MSGALTAIIVAAGSSQRMGFDKLFADLAGLPVVARSIAAFEACAEVESILVVTRPEREDEFHRLAREHGWDKLHALLPGGAARHLSVWNGLESVAARCGTGSGWVAVHDGARPLVTPELISRCFRLAQEAGAACCAAPVSDTLKRAGADSLISGSVDRANLWGMQTPQIFSFPVLYRAYESLLAAGLLVTDEASALEELGLPVALLNSGEYNLKITYPPDLRLAEFILAARQQDAAPAR
jgi:2-C-methyl-D-erythritol 4-phosphate cytidylyltransferase